MDKVIVVTKTSTYGIERFYPVKECILGQMILELTGRRTLTDSDIETLGRYGFRVVTQPETISRLRQEQRNRLRG